MFRIFFPFWVVFFLNTAWAYTIDSEPMQFLKTPQQWLEKINNNEDQDKGWILERAYSFLEKVLPDKWNPSFNVKLLYGDIAVLEKTSVTQEESGWLLLSQRLIEKYPDLSEKILWKLIKQKSDKAFQLLLDCYLAGKIISNASEIPPLSKAVTLLEWGVENGYDALCRLPLVGLHLTEQHPNPDIYKALHLLSEGAGHRDWACVYEMALLYLNGWIGKRQKFSPYIRKGITLLSLCHEAGYEVASVKLGHLYRTGTYVPKDFIQAFFCLYPIKDKNHLAEMELNFLQQMIFPNVNKKKILKVAQKALEGEGASWRELSRIYKEGSDGIPKNEELVVKYLLNAILGRQDSQLSDISKVLKGKVTKAVFILELADFILMDSSKIYEQKMALSLLSIAEKLGVPNASYHYAVALIKGDFSKEEYTLGIQKLEQCAYNGSLEASVKVIEIFCRQIPEKAVYYAHLAAKQGSAWACQILGNCYSIGYGVYQDYSRAVFFWGRAKDLGCLEAEQDLEEFKKLLGEKGLKTLKKKAQEHAPSRLLFNTYVKQNPWPEWMKGG